MTHDERTIAAVIDQHTTTGMPTQSTLHQIALECSRLTHGDPFEVAYDAAAGAVVATHRPQPMRISVAESPGFVMAPAHAIPPVRVQLAAATT